MTRPIHAAILGASGYGAGELLRLLVHHPAATVVSVTSTSQVGEPIDRVHPHLRGFYDELRVAAAVDFERLLAAEHAVVFSSLPHGASATAIEGLLRAARDRVRVIDLSGDFRLADATTHERYYPESPLLPELRAQFVYGLPELNRTHIRAARYVANPGCLATAAILAAAPLAASGFAGTLAVDAKTGSSGSGRQLKETTHHPTRHADCRAYKPLAHQHEPEILQALGDPRGDRWQLSFVAQSLDLARGIFVTLHATWPHDAGAAVRTRSASERDRPGAPPHAALACASRSEKCRPLAQGDLVASYRAFYADHPFVRIVDDESPALQNVVGSNFCDLAVAARGRQVLVMAAIDNLVKGMAGTAIQNMNLMCGLPETTGLWWPSFRPV